MLVRLQKHYSLDTIKNKPGILNRGVFYLNTTQLAALLMLMMYYERKFILESGNFSVKNLHLKESMTGLNLHSRCDATRKDQNYETLHH